MISFLDKIIFVRFICPTCKNESFIKADKRCEFASYMQCCHCNACLSIYSQILSSSVQVKALNAEETKWLLNIEERSANTSSPLRIYRTKYAL